MKGSCLPPNEMPQICAGDEADAEVVVAPSGSSAAQDLAPSEEAASNVEGQVLDIVSEPPMKKLRQDGDDPHEALVLSLIHI